MFEQYAHLWPELAKASTASPAQSPSLRLAPRRPYCWVADASGRAVFLPPEPVPRPGAELRVQPWPEAAQAAGVQRLLGAEAGVDAIPSSWTRCHDYCRARRGTPGLRVLLGRRGWTDPSGAVVWDAATAPP